MANFLKGLFLMSYLRYAALHFCFYQLNKWTFDNTPCHLYFQEPAKLEQDVTQTTAIGSGATPVDNGKDTSKG